MDEYGTLIEPPAVPFRFGAPGWYVVGVLLLLLLAATGILLYRHYRRNRYRREALRWLAQQEAATQQNGAHADLIYATNMVLKRIAMSRYGRTVVAPVRGMAWIDLLNKTGKPGLFDQRDSALLQDQLYVFDPAMLPAQAAAFISKAKQWIQQHQRSYAF